ncbi:MAG: hypothetical protein RIS31_1020, partial [Actinomycetota bacterium]
SEFVHGFPPMEIVDPAILEEVGTY